MRGWSLLFGALAGASSLAGCDLAPRYQPPTMALPASWTGKPPFGVARPTDRIARGPWWTSYGNPMLDALEARLPANPNLAAEAERFQQARDLSVEAEARLYPRLSASLEPSENRESPEALFRSPTSTSPLTEGNIESTIAASWELDLWGAIRNAGHEQKRLAQAEAASLASLDLSLQAELADEYILLRGLDGEALVYRQSVDYYRKGVDITTLRLADKIGSGLDVGRAQSQLSSAEAGLLDTEAARAVALHAIADLIGVPAGSLSLPPQQDTPLREPTIPVGVPSDLLERRPDVAAAEREMAAANSAIGVARAAFYPNVSLAAVAGIDSSGGDLFNLSERAWSVGADVLQPIFAGGFLEAELRRSHSAYRQTADLYRATVLGAAEQVEDGLSNVDLLNREVLADRQAVASAGRVQDLALTLYQAGADSYLDVVVAQVTALTSGVTEVQTATRALQASVDLVRALGGGWDGSELPAERSIPAFDPLVPG